MQQRAVIAAAVVAPAIADHRGRADDRARRDRAVPDPAAARRAAGAPCDRPDPDLARSRSDRERLRARLRHVCGADRESRADRAALPRAGPSLHAGPCSARSSTRWSKQARADGDARARFPTSPQPPSGLPLSSALPEGDAGLQRAQEPPAFAGRSPGTRAKCWLHVQGMACTP